MSKDARLAFLILALVLAGISVPVLGLCCFTVGVQVFFRVVQQKMIDQMNDDVMIHGDLLPPHRLREKR